MKIGSCLCIAIICTWVAGPHTGWAQSRFRSKHLKYVDEARHKAVTNTLVPLVVGTGAAYFIHNKTVQTSASFLVVYGLMVGPSTGNVYAGDYVRGMLGIAARIGGGYLMKDATREILGDNVAEAVGWDKKHVSLGDPQVLAGAGLIVGSAIYNIISSKASVHRFNRSQGYYIRPNTQYRNGRFVPMISGMIAF